MYLICTFGASKETEPKDLQILDVSASFEIVNYSSEWPPPFKQNTVRNKEYHGVWKAWPESTAVMIAC